MTQTANKGDPGLYDFSPYRDRPRIVWPNGKTVAVWVAPNLEYYEIDPPANPHRKSWTKPHPDVVGFGQLLRCGLAGGSIS